MIQFDEHIFQLGWFNQQLVNCMVNIVNDVEPRELQHKKSWLELPGVSFQAVAKADLERQGFLSCQRMHSNLMKL